MLIVKKWNGDIFYEGISEEDCLANMPSNPEDYLILPYEQYDAYIDHLVSIQENLDMG